MSRVPPILFAALLAATLAGCASVLDSLGGEDTSGVGRGRAFAQEKCARCHAAGALGSSPRTDAPPFRTLGVRFTQPSLERELEAISVVGHFDMPPLPTGPDDRRDLIAYIKTLGRGVN